MSAPGRRVLVAGIGNVFLGDDGFGVEVVGRIDASALPSTVEVADYGIRGVHLVYELLDGRHDTLIMVDAVPLDGPPGTLAVLEVDPPTGPASADPPTGPASSDSPTGAVSTGPPTAAVSAPEPSPPPALDGHGMDPEAVLGLLHAIGGAIDRVLVVGCRPAVIEERMGLSEPVRAVVDDAVSLVTELACEEAAKPGRAERRPADA
ncbi:hydrogenase maturation protease [Actinoallomurus sp. CA-150999]|uniref:hydrogenase maturation protease n=1 Tax=Actinoallomurus sp. CA-150999 TaxID=3239887 RepID=UPI003D92DA04